MTKEPYFDWDEETGRCLCAIEDEKHRPFIGTATCHPTDFDMISRRTGEEIAYRRARLELIAAAREDIKTQLGAYKQLYYSMKHSRRYNDKSYEARMLKRFIHRFEEDLATAKEVLADERASLKQYLEMKDRTYESIRAKRDK